MDKRKFSRLKEDPSQLQMFADEAMTEINEQHHEIGQIEETLPNKANLVGGKVPSTELPSYVDDVVEYASLNDFPEEGEQGKIYLAIDTGLCYRWSGTQYMQVAGSTAVLMFASQANFPEEGEEGVIYVAEDTNKQYRWTGTAYVELSTADCIEVVNHQRTIPLTDAQIEKALAGKLAVVAEVYSGFKVLMVPYDIYSNVIRFVSSKVFGSSMGDAYFSYIESATYYSVELNVSTKLFGYVIQSGRSFLSSSQYNVIANTDTPDASGKQIVRALNLRKTQDMIANVYDATATYAVGDYCIYQNDLYVCNTAISTAEAWNSSHWTKVNVAGQLQSKSDVEIVKSSSNFTLTAAQLNKWLACKLILVWSQGSYQVGNADNGVFVYNFDTNDGTEAASNAVIWINSNSVGYYRVLRAYVNKTTGAVRFSYTGISNVFQGKLLFNPTVPSGTTPISLQIVKDNTNGNYYSLAPQAMTQAEIESILKYGAVVDPVLANNSWETIRKVCEAGDASTYWQVGDTKTDVGTDSTTRTFRICDMQGLYGKHVVFEQVELEDTNYVWASNNVNDYSLSNMRTTHLPSILVKYSSELQAFITDTAYKVAKGGNDGTILELTDKLFLPAEKELYGSLANKCRSEEAAALTQFQYYATHSSNADHIKHEPGQTSGNMWWQRSPYAGDTSNVCRVYSDGSRSGNSAYSSHGVAPCFSF